MSLAQRQRVNSISPGAIRTPMNLEELTTPESYRELLSLIPCKRLGQRAISFTFGFHR